MLRQGIRCCHHSDLHGGLRSIDGVRPVICPQRGDVEEVIRTVKTYTDGLTSERIRLAGRLVVGGLVWLTVAEVSDLSVHAEIAVPVVTESVVPSPFKSEASTHRARSGMEYLLSAVLAGTNV